MLRISTVVEGDGDQGALPVVLRRHLHDREVFDIEIGKPINAKGRSKLLRAGELERFVKLAALQPNAGAVLVLCDADDDLACELGPEMTKRCQDAIPHIPVRACLAVREFENWLLASPETLAPVPQAALSDYESTAAQSRVAEWCLPKKYVKPVQQPALASQIDMQRVSSRCPSFARLLRCVDELVAHISS